MNKNRENYGARKQGMNGVVEWREVLKKRLATFIRAHRRSEENPREVGRDVGGKGCIHDEQRNVFEPINVNGMATR